MKMTVFTKFQFVESKFWDWGISLILHQQRQIFYRTKILHIQKFTVKYCWGRTFSEGVLYKFSYPSPSSDIRPLWNVIIEILCERVRKIISLVWKSTLLTFYRKWELFIGRWRPNCWNCMLISDISYLDYLLFLIEFFF